MLLDVRTYTCRPGTIKKHLELYEKYGKAPQTRHLGQPLAYLVTETGNPNQYVHIWVYENAGDREAKRAAMQADPVLIQRPLVETDKGVRLCRPQEVVLEIL